MNTTQKGIIALIKSGITGVKCHLPDDFNLEEASKEMLRHGIAPLAYNGAVYCGISKDDPIMRKLFTLYIKQMMRSENQINEIKRLMAAFDEAGIDYLPLKGTHMKHLYPKPELRQMGDADILIREAQYPEAKKVLQGLGFTFKCANPHDYTWITDSLYLELHITMFPFVLKDFFRYYGDGWKLAELDERHQYRFISPEDEYIYIFTHYAKHYRGGGIGLRHLTDLWVYRRAHPSMDDSKIADTLKSLKLYDFYINTMNLLKYWLYEDVCSELSNIPVDVEKAEFMSKYIFASGNWGSVKSHALGTAVREMHNSNSEQFDQKKGFIKLIFPPLETMRVRYPILKKIPVLLPIFWGVRIFVALTSRRKNIQKHWKGNQYSTVERIETYQEALDYVGLGFDF